MHRYIHTTTTTTTNSSSSSSNNNDIQPLSEVRGPDARDPSRAQETVAVLFLAAISYYYY